MLGFWMSVSVSVWLRLWLWLSGFLAGLSAILYIVERGQLHRWPTRRLRKDDDVL